MRNQPISDLASCRDPKLAIDFHDPYLDWDDPTVFSLYLKTLDQDDLDTQLWMQAEHGDIDKAKLCLAAGADPLSHNGGELTTPLARACIKNKPDMVRFLAPISDLGAQDLAGDTLAHRCCQEGSPESLLELLAAGDRFTTANQRSETAIFEAIRYGINIWETHSIFGMNPSSDTDPSSPLQKYGRCLDILLRHADLSATNAAGQTPLDIAIDTGSHKCADAIRAILAGLEHAALDKETPAAENPNEPASCGHQETGASRLSRPKNL